MRAGPCWESHAAATGAASAFSPDGSILLLDCGSGCALYSELRCWRTLPSVFRYTGSPSHQQFAKVLLRVSDGRVLSRRVDMARASQECTFQSNSIVQCRGADCFEPSMCTYTQRLTLPNISGASGTTIRCGAPMCGIDCGVTTWPMGALV